MPEKLKLVPVEKIDLGILGDKKIRGYFTDDFKKICGANLLEIQHLLDKHKPADEEVEVLIHLVQLLCAGKSCLSTKNRGKLLAEAKESFGPKWFDELCLKPIVLREEQNGLSIFIVTDEGIPLSALSEATDFGIGVAWFRTHTREITRHMAGLIIGLCNAPEHRCINGVIMI